MTPELEKLLASWEKIAERDIASVMSLPTVKVERGALRSLLTAVRVELPA